MCDIAIARITGCASSLRIDYRSATLLRTSLVLYTPEYIVHGMVLPLSHKSVPLCFCAPLRVSDLFSVFFLLNSPAFFEQENPSFFFPAGA